MGVEINPFKAPSLTLYITPSSRVSSGPPDVAMCQSPVPSLSSFQVFFPFLSPNHMPWYSLITMSMLLFCFLVVGWGVFVQIVQWLLSFPNVCTWLQRCTSILFPAAILDYLIWTCAPPLSYSISLPYFSLSSDHHLVKNTLTAFLPCVSD